MKVEQCSQTDALSFAAADQPAALSRADETSTYPVYSGDGKRTPKHWVGKESAAMKDEHSPGKAPQRLVEIDTAKYQKYLDDPSLSDDQKQEIIDALWTIIVSFVDLGFGIHPVQEAMDDGTCGQLTAELDRNGDTDSNDPKPVQQSLQDAFNAASDDT